jgi:hypothetical protein
MAQPRGPCIFCGDVGILTGEHVFSRWTHKYLPPRGSNRYSSLRGTAYRTHTEFEKVSRTGDVRDIKAVCVCGPKCNNGWMRSKIENPSIPLLKKLIQGQYNGRLFPNQQKMIASWAVLKAIVSQYDIGENVTVPAEDRTFLMNNHYPPLEGWGVWIAHFSHHPKRAHPSSWVAVPFYMPARDEPPSIDGRPPYYNSAAFTQIIGELFIRSIHTTFPNFARRIRFPLPDGGTLLRIWPPSEISIAWPQRPISDNDAHAASWAVKDWFERIAAANAPPQ